MQNTARQSKTQDCQNTHNYLRLTRQAADIADIIQSIQQTCHAGIHYARPNSKGLYPPARVFSPISPLSHLSYPPLSY